MQRYDFNICQCGGKLLRCLWSLNMVTSKQEVIISGYTLYLTIEKVHRITDVGLTEWALEEKRKCTPIFPDMEQGFDKVWHDIRNQ